MPAQAGTTTKLTLEVGGGLPSRYTVSEPTGGGMPGPFAFAIILLPYFRIAHGIQPDGSSLAPGPDPPTGKGPATTMDGAGPFVWDELV